MAGIGDGTSDTTDIDPEGQPTEHPSAESIGYRSELLAAPSRADLGRHAAWWALG